MSKIDALLKRAKRVTGEWRPDTYSVTKTKEGIFRVIRTLWNGVAGSLNPSHLERTGINPYSERLYRTRKEAQEGIAADIAAFEKAHDMKLSPSPRINNLCVPETNAEKKELWRAQGGTVMEYLAENSGLSLENYIRKEFGPPQYSEHEMKEKLAWYASIIKWRKEDGIDGEEAVEISQPEGSPASCDKNSE